MIQGLSLSPCHRRRRKDSASEHRTAFSRSARHTGGRDTEDLSKGKTTQVSDRKCTYGRDLRPQPQDDELLPQLVSESMLAHLQIYCQPAKMAPQPRLV